MPLSGAASSSTASADDLGAPWLIQMTDYSSFAPDDGLALRLRDMFEPKRPSSMTGIGVGSGDAPSPTPAPRPTMGEYERNPGVGAGENDETWRSITNSCVAFVSCTIFVRRVDERVLPAAGAPLVGCRPGVPGTVTDAGAPEGPPGVPRVLTAFDSCMTV